jgi:hypothetical protein
LSFLFRLFAFSFFVFTGFFFLIVRNYRGSRADGGERRGDDNEHPPRERFFAGSRLFVRLGRHGLLSGDCRIDGLFRFVDVTAYGTELCFVVFMIVRFRYNDVCDFFAVDKLLSAADAYIMVFKTFRGVSRTEVGFADTLICNFQFAICNYKKIREKRYPPLPFSLYRLIFSSSAKV